MTIASLLTALVHVLSQMGAHHVHTSVQHGTGYAATKHLFAVVCKIPAGHGTFYCSGWIKR